MEKDILIKLIDHMLLVANTYNTDKTFGKLIVTLIKTNNVIEVVDKLQLILKEHKSIWKGQASKLLCSRN